MKKSSALVAFLTIGFFLAFPLVGMLLFWNDAHSKIQGRAVEFVKESFEPFVASLQAGKPNEDSSIHLRESYDAESFRQLKGNAKITSVTPDLSWAREEDDKGIQYARLLIEVSFGSKTVSMRTVLRRETVAPRWRYHEIEILSK